VRLVDGLTGDEREATLVRRQVHIKSISVAQIIDEQAKIGYIKMTGFQKSSPEELDAALASLQHQGLRALIWDLRGNPGGLLTAAVEVLDRFIDNGVLVSTRGRTRDQNWTYQAHGRGTLQIPLVLLTDGESASASEIVAGAIRDHRRGVIVGRPTYGKWSVQSIFPIRDDSGLRLTTAKFYSPDGHTYGKVGVQPDVRVEAGVEHQVSYRAAPAVPGSQDRDVQKGLEILRGQLAQR
jgi:carboxyl-terminal processing protease